MEEDQFRGQEPGGENVSREGIERLRTLLGGSRVAMLTTTEAGGALRSRPMAVQEISDEGDAWLITQQSSPKVEEVEREHHVNLAFYRPARGRYVSVSGRATVVRDDAKLRALWHPTLQAWFPDGLDDPDLCLLRVRLDKAETWNAPVGNLMQVARLAGSLLGRTPRATREEGRDTVILRTRQAGIGDTAGIFGTAGGNMGVAPRAPREKGGPRVTGAAGGTMGEARMGGARAETKPTRGAETAGRGAESAGRGAEAGAAARATGRGPAKAEREGGRAPGAKEGGARGAAGRGATARGGAARKETVGPARTGARMPEPHVTEMIAEAARATPATGGPPGGAAPKPPRGAGAKAPPRDAMPAAETKPEDHPIPRKGGRGRS